MQSKCRREAGDYKIIFPCNAEVTVAILQQSHARRLTIALADFSTALLGTRHSQKTKKNDMHCALTTLERRLYIKIHEEAGALSNEIGFAKNTAPRFSVTLHPAKPPSEFRSMSERKVIARRVVMHGSGGKLASHPSLNWPAGAGR
jgi:hypothetical protein